MNRNVQHIFEMCFLFFSCMPQSGVARLYGISINNLHIDYLLQLSIVAAPTYILTNSAQAPLSLHALNPCVLSCFRIAVITGVR